MVAFDAFHLLSCEPERIDMYVAEVARVLKPGGVFVFFERGVLHVPSSGLAAEARFAVCKGVLQHVNCALPSRAMRLPAVKGEGLAGAVQSLLGFSGSAVGASHSMACPA